MLKTNVLSRSFSRPRGGQTDEGTLLGIQFITAVNDYILQDAGHFRLSRTSYQQGVVILRRLVDEERDLSTKAVLERNVVEFDTVVQELSLKAADETMKMALTMDEAKSPESIDLYLAAAELYIAYKRYLDSRGEDSTAIKSRAQKILDRVSELKGM